MKSKRAYECRCASEHHSSCYSLYLLTVPLFKKILPLIHKECYRISLIIILEVLHTMILCDYVFPFHIKLIPLHSTTSFMSEFCCQRLIFV